MEKGFIYFKGKKIPFLIDNYCMKLFTGKPILSSFCKEYNFKDNYILLGKIFDNDVVGKECYFFCGKSHKKYLQSQCQEIYKEIVKLGETSCKISNISVKLSCINLIYYTISC